MQPRGILPSSNASVFLGILRLDGEDYLLINERAPEYWNRGGFCLPGGKGDPGERPWQTAVREFLEENDVEGKIDPASIQLLPTRRPVVIPSGYGHLYHIVPALLTKEQAALLRPNKEVSRLYFVPIRALLEQELHAFRTPWGHILGITADGLEPAKGLPVFPREKPEQPWRKERFIHAVEIDYFGRQITENAMIDITRWILGPTAHAIVYALGELVFGVTEFHENGFTSAAAFERSDLPYFDREASRFFKAHPFANAYGGVSEPFFGNDVMTSASRMLGHLGNEKLLHFHLSQSLHSDPARTGHAFNKFLVHAFYMLGLREGFEMLPETMRKLSGATLLHDPAIEEIVLHFSHEQRGEIAERLGAWAATGTSLRDAWFIAMRETAHLARNPEYGFTETKEAPLLGAQLPVLAALGARIAAAEMLAAFPPQGALSRFDRVRRDLTELVRHGVAAPWMQEESSLRDTLARHSGFAAVPCDNLASCIAEAGELLRSPRGMAQELDERFFDRDDFETGYICQRQTAHHHPYALRQTSVFLPSTNVQALKMLASGNLCLPTQPLSLQEPHLLHGVARAFAENERLRG
ncbi:MAG: NUDIX domain-containing protein [Alphaproteobacteria bacterium]|nr:NUDIX domain-containing protein [Alphaproteobacteria bacterium]